MDRRQPAEEEARHRGEQLRLMISGVKDYAILMLDPEGFVTSWNEGAERIKGYRAEEIVGQHFSRFYTPEAIAKSQPRKGLKKAADDGRYEEEGWRVRRDGSRFFASVVITAIRDQKGQLRGFGKMTRDITERREAQEALFLEKERAQITLNSIGDAVISTDISGNVVFLNPVAEEMTGWSQQDATGRPITEVFQLIDANSREISLDPMGMGVGQNRTSSLPSNCVLIRRDGAEVPIENSISPIRDREGRITGGSLYFAT
jgi:PAS domain S-box-containing protein